MSRKVWIVAKKASKNKFTSFEEEKKQIGFILEFRWMEIEITKLSVCLPIHNHYLKTVDITNHVYSFDAFYRYINAFVFPESPHLTNIHQRFWFYNQFLLAIYGLKQMNIIINATLY